MCHFECLCVSCWIGVACAAISALSYLPIKLILKAIMYSIPQDTEKDVYESEDLPEEDQSFEPVSQCKQ